MSKFQISQQQQKIIKEIAQLKKEKNAILLAHNYMRPEIFEAADVCGDSFELSKKAMETDAEIIVFAGVHFMAETAKLLNPEKKVLLPSLRAGCFMADMITADRLKIMKQKHPNAGVCLYVNSAASVKAEADICCTSANAVEMVERLPHDEIIFAPDKHLAEYVATKTKKRIIPWSGFCHVHTNFSHEKIVRAKEKYPHAKIMMHPETPGEFLKYADHICGTGGMITFSKKDDAKEYLVGTEEGMVWRLRKEVPEKEFYPLMGSCINMKQITLENIRESLIQEKYDITIDPKIFEKAKRSLTRMMEL
ncbi:quinolinate synthase NadA [Candidatus Peregrinibacteria bacterium]|nr:quinolinate synthase NadA [Candidatus Peregrinibacteria bacterium]